MKNPTPRRAARAFLVLAAVLSVSACATKGDLRDVRTEIRSVYARQDSILAELRFQSSVTQDTLISTTRELFNIRGAVIQRLQRIEDDLDRLAESVGLLTNSVSSMRDQMAMSGQAPPRGVSGGREPEGMTGGGADLFNAGVDNFNRGNFGTARAAFRDFIDQFPNHESVPQARMNLAEIMVMENDPRGAIEQFMTVPELHPLAPEVPNAMYRAALLHIELAQDDEARDLLQRVINTYQEEAVAELARQELAKLGGQS